jgi:hypothetical protein
MIRQLHRCPTAGSFKVIESFIVPPMLFDQDLRTPTGLNCGACLLHSQLCMRQNGSLESWNHGITEGKAILYNNCQKAIQWAFKEGPVGIKEATQDKYDIIMEITQIRESMSVKVEAIWVERHLTPVENK